MASIVPKEKQMTIAQKKALLDKAADKINDKAKKIICGRIGRTPEIQEKLNIKWIATPSYKINQLAGGGFPRGKFSIVSGAEDSGKTSILLETIAYQMKTNPDFVAIWLESENSLNLEYIVETFNIDPERFFFIEHEKDGGAEVAMDILSAIADSGAADIVVVNSLKALVPKTELENSLEKDTIALQARFNSKMIKKFTARTQEHDTAFVIVTHLTTLIGTMSKNPYVLAGGKAIRYASMLTLEFNKVSILEGDPITKEEGLKIRVTCRKNHCVCNRFPYGAIDYYVRYGEGVAWEIELMQAAFDMGILVQKGAWISEIDQQTQEVAVDENGSPLKWNGKNAFKEYIVHTPSYRKKLEAMVNGTFEIEALSDEELKEIQSDEVDCSKAVTEMEPEPNQDPIEASRKAKKSKQ